MKNQEGHNGNKNSEQKPINEGHSHPLHGEDGARENKTTHDSHSIGPRKPAKSK